MNDNVSHPIHYNQGKIEVIEFLEDQKLGFHLGNAVKYISRAGRKNPATYKEDLQKAIWYLRRYLEINFADNPRRPNDMDSDKGTRVWLKIVNGMLVPPYFMIDPSGQVDADQYREFREVLK